MAVDIWEGLAERLDLDYAYQSFPTLRALVDATAAAEIDVAVTNLTITRERAERVDFTQPWFDAGLRVMVDEAGGTGFVAVFTGLRDAGHLRAYAWLGLVVVVATILLTLFDRRFDPAFPRRWREGIAESFYAVMSVATSGRIPSRKNLFGWIGRIWQAAWLVCGIAVLAYVTSSVTSVMTTLSLTHAINGLQDLPGKTVGVFEGSVAEGFVREVGISHRSYAGIEDAAAALRSGEVAAVVGDAPVLEYYAHTHPEAPLAVVGPIFEPDKYGFAVPRGSPLWKPLTLELLSAREGEEVAELRERYFGEAG
jgi:polar amino acid transport system substrate-binding protein